MGNDSFMSKDIEWVNIATFDRELDTERMEKLLLANGILPGIHGSRCYAIAVPKERVEEAVRILKQSEFKDKMRWWEA